MRKPIPVRSTSRRVVLSILLVTTLFLSRGWAQESIDRAMAARIRAEALEHGNAGELFHALVDGIGGRLTGSPSHLAAIRWARERLGSWGLSGVNAEPFPFGRGWSLEKLTLEMTAPRYMPLTGYPEGWTPSTKGTLTGKVVYVGNKTLAQIDAMGDALRGAIVLPNQMQTQFIDTDRPQPTTSNTAVRIGNPAAVPSRSVTPMQDLLAALKRKGAGAILRPSNGIHGTVFALGDRTTPDDAVPTVVLAAEHYNMLVRLAEAGTPPELRVEVRARYHSDDTASYNVVGEIPGTDSALKDQIVLIGAHLDSWHASNGATDNADGATGAMEAMRILSTVKAQPRRTIRLVLWGGEEQGLLGSRAYVQQHFADPASRNRLAVFLNDDPGTGPIYGFFMQGNAAAKAIFDAWLEPFRDLGARKNILEGIGATDHVPFDEAGMPAFTAIKDYTGYDLRTRHGNGDFPDRVNPKDLEESAIVLATFAWQAATRNMPIPRSTLQR
jgi:carboxypeptidase Q